MTDKPTPTDTPPPCDQELFDQGVSVGLFDIPKWTAEALCRGIAAATEARVDWHYIGGRVHIKALPAARAPADSVQEDAARYRHLRNKSQVVLDRAWFGGMSVRNHYGDFLCRDDALAALDTAIDADRKQGATQ